MPRQVLLYTTLASVLLSLVLAFEAPMLRRLPAPYRGNLVFPAEDEPYTGHTSSTPYTMQPGDVLVGLQEYGYWSPYPRIFSGVKEIEGVAFTGGPYVVNYVYPTGTARSLRAQYVSRFFDTVTVTLHPYQYSNLIINPKTLNRLAGYRRLRGVAQLDADHQVKISTYSMGCFGGRPEEYFGLSGHDSGTLFTYRSYPLDTTLIVRIPYSAFLKDLMTDLYDVQQSGGGFTTTTYYHVKGANGIVGVDTETRSYPGVEAVLTDLRFRALPDSDGAWH